MKFARHAMILTIILLVTACGRQLPDEYFQTTTDREDTVEEVVADDTAEDTADDAAEDTADDTAEDTADDAAEDTAEEVDPIIELVANADVANGEALFNGGVPPCVSCHFIDKEDMLVGPGMLHLPERAAERVEGMVAERYLYNSITAPNDYIVEGFTANLMPPNFADLYSEEEIYDIIAYMMTFE